MYRVQRILFEDCGPVWGIRERVVNSYTCDNEAKARQLVDRLMSQHRHESASYWYFIMDIESQELLLKTNDNKYAPQFTPAF